MTTQTTPRPYTDREIDGILYFWSRIPDAQAARLATTVRDQRALLRRALAAMQATEFPCPRGGTYYCPDCGWGESAGHGTDCETGNTIAALQEALAGTEEA